jgi:hypothetical protein
MAKIEEYPDDTCTTSAIGNNIGEVTPIKGSIQAYTSFLSVKIHPHISPAEICLMFSNSFLTGA